MAVEVANPPTEDEEPAPPPEGRSDRRWVRWVRPPLLILSTLVLTFAALAVILELWDIRMDVPLHYTGDVNFYGTVVKGTIDHGWYLDNPDLGAPFGLDFRDFPLSDNNLQLLLVKVLGWFSTEPAVVMNAFFILTFPLVALSSVFVLRRLGVSSPVSVVVAVLYTFVPFHFTRGENHLFFSLYLAVPLGACLALMAFYGNQPPPGMKRLPIVGLILLALIVGSTGVYYTVFTLVLLATATLIGFVRHRRWRGLVFGIVAAALASGTLMVNILPTVLHRGREGVNPEVAMRSPFDTELYSLKLSSLVTPVIDHRFEPFADLRARYEDFPLRSEHHPLGGLGTVGFLWLGGLALASVAGVSVNQRFARHGPPAAMVVVAVAVATIGGGSTLIAIMLTTQFRAWNRMVIFIGFLSLLAVAWLLDDLGDWLRRKRWPRPVLVGLLGIVLFVGLWDQTTPTFVPDYKGLAGEYQSDRDYVRMMEGRLAPGSIVHQMPYAPFPEPGPQYGLIDYDHLRLYQHSRTLRWTHGAMRGRPEDWSSQLSDEPLDLGLPALTAAGVNAISLDRGGYRDDGVEVEGELRRLIGEEPAVSANGRLAFYDLSSYRQQLESNVQPDRLMTAREAVLRPVRPVFVKGFHDRDANLGDWWHWALEQAEIEIINPTGHERQVRVEFLLEAAAVGSWTLTVDKAGEPGVVAMEGGSLTRFTGEMSFVPGSTILRLTTDAPLLRSPDFSARAFRVINFSLIDAAVLELAPPPPPEPESPPDGPPQGPPQPPS